MTGRDDRRDYSRNAARMTYKRIRFHLSSTADAESLYVYVSTSLASLDIPWRKTLLP